MTIQNATERKAERRRKTGAAAKWIGLTVVSSLLAATVVHFWSKHILNREKLAKGQGTDVLPAGEPTANTPPYAAVQNAAWNPYTPFPNWPLPQPLTNPWAPPQAQPQPNPQPAPEPAPSEVHHHYHGDPE